MNRKTALLFLSFIVALSLILPGALPEAFQHAYANSTDAVKASPVRTDRQDIVVEGEEKLIVQELIENRTTFSKDYEMNDGSISKEISLVPMHYEDANGDFQEIDTSLVHQSELSLAKVTPSIDANSYVEAIVQENKRSNMKNSKLNAASKSKSSFLAPEVPFYSNIPADFSQGYSIEKEGERFTFIPLQANQAIGAVDSKEKNKIVYTNVWKDTDVELIVTEYGIKENIILHSSDAPAQFEFIYKNETASDSSDESKLHLLPSWLIDANGTTRDVESKFITRGADTIIQVKWDNKGLVYPITIDPTSTITPNLTLFVDRLQPTKSFTFDPIMKAGGPTQQYISYFRFLLKDIFPEGTTFNSAKVHLFMDKVEKVSGSSEIYNYIALAQTDRELSPGATYNDRPSTNNNYPKSNFVAMAPQTYAVFDVTNAVKDSHSKKMNYVSLMTVTPYSGVTTNIIEFLTPWQSDKSKTLKIVINYGSSNSAPQVSFTSVVKNDDNSVSLNWQLNNSPLQEQVKYEIFPLKGTWQTDGIISVQSNEKSYRTQRLGAGDWSFAVRSFNGTVWSEWSFTNYISIINPKSEYIYNQSNQLIKISHYDGVTTNFTYDKNGNLTKRNNMGTSSTAMIPDGNPVEWISRSGVSSFTDGYNDFIYNVTSEKEPERDIRSVYYYKDANFLYVMLELGRISNYPLLLPHGYDNDNYFIYLPTSSSANPKATYSRNGTALGIDAKYEIASWHPDDVTVHHINDNGWAWKWTGGYEFDGLSSKYQVLYQDATRLTTSAILELKVPLSQIPDANLTKMVVIAASDSKDVDIAKK